MMAEPATIALGSLRLFSPIYQACDKLYEGWRRTQSFGDDLDQDQADLELQFAIFKATSKLNIYELRDPIEHENEYHERTNALRRYLDSMLHRFQACDNLIQKYPPKAPPRRLTKPRPITIDHASILDIPVAAQNGSDENSHKTKSRRTLKSLFGNKDKSKTPSSGLNPVTTKVKSATPNTSSDAKRTLDIPEMQEESQKREMNVKTLQNVDFWDRAKWAAGDHLALKNMIDSIKAGNDGLRKFLKLRPLKDVTVLLPRPQGLEPLYNVGKSISTSLAYIHESLKSLNYRRKGQEPYSLSIQLREDNDASRKDLAQAEGVMLQDGSVVFNLQRHDASETARNPTTLALESFQACNDLQARNKLQNITELHKLGNPTGTINATEDDTEVETEVETWGYFRTPGSASTYNILYHDKASLWPASITLADILSGPDYVEHINPIQVIQVARIIAVGYLYHSEVRASCGDPRSQNFRYYLTAEDSSGWNEEEPLVLNPWLSYGFGQRSARPPTGSGSGVAKPLNASVVELGLLLYQVACGQVLQYSKGPNGFRKARSEAMNGLHIVTRAFGISLTDIVQSCLEYEGAEFFLTARTSADSDFDFIEKVVSALYACEKTFGDNTSPAFAFRQYVDEIKEQLDEEQLDSEPVLPVAMAPYSSTLAPSTSSLNGGKRGSSIAETMTIGEEQSVAQTIVAQSSSCVESMVLENKDIEQASIEKEDLVLLPSPPSGDLQHIKLLDKKPPNTQEILLEA